MAVKQQPYDLDDDVVISTTFTNEVGGTVDPGSVTLRVDCPDGVALSQAKDVLDNPSPGVWEWTYRVANGWGIYEVTWTADNPFGIVTQDRFHVRRPAAADSPTEEA